MFGGCEGEVGEVETDTDSADEERPTRDASKKRDAGKRDARADSDEDEQDREDEDEDEDDGDETAVPRVTPDGGPKPDPRRDGGRDATTSDSDDDSSDAATESDGGSGSDGPGTCPDGSSRAAAAGLKIREIALYQTVKIPLYKDGSWVSQPSSPIVQGKKTLVRVFVDTQSGYERHPVRGSLVLETGGSKTEIVDEKTITTSSTDKEADSTFSFQVDGAQIGANTQISVALEELECGEGGQAAEGTRFPTTGTQALTTTAIGKLRMVIIPVNVGGRLPVTTEAEIANIKNALLAYYPVPDVEVTVRDRPIMWSGSLAGTDNRAWTNMLNQVMRERSSDRPEGDVYYFGLVQPAASMQQYCGRGCILGIAPQATRVSAQTQVGLGASFNNAQTYETIVHEIGHSHGRPHAPCARGGNIAGVDSRFPDRMGSIISWGWDSRSNKLLDPTSYKDVMGYCSPNWISNYTYNALADRGTQVNKRAFVLGGVAGPLWHDVILYADGGARWGGNRDADDPGGDVESAQVLDASGAVIADIEVMRVPLSHNDDQLLYVPEPGARWSRIVLKDRVLTLSDVQAPL